jgi:hypothetical protein
MSPGHTLVVRTFVLLLAACSSTSTPTYSLVDLPVTRWTAGLPVTGDGTLVVALTPAAPTNWAKATGHVTFTCDRCTLGDDRAQLQIEFMGATAIDFGHLTFDTVRARADFAGGQVVLVSQWRSPEVELDAKVTGVLARSSADTRLDGCVRFRPTDALHRRDQKLFDMLSLTGAWRDDRGYFYIRLDGTLGEMRKLPQRCDV